MEPARPQGLMGAVLVFAAYYNTFRR